MSRRFYLIVTLLVIAAATRQTTHGEEPAPAIDVQDHRAQIRSALMHYTPPGTSSHDVLAFIRNRLRPDAALPPVENHPAIGESAEQSNKRGVKSIRLPLGQYLAHPEVVFLTAPLVMQREAIAQWAFDDHDRLLEIFVDKKSALY